MASSFMYSSKSCHHSNIQHHNHLGQLNTQSSINHVINQYNIIHQNQVLKHKDSQNQVTYKMPSEPIQTCTIIAIKFKKNPCSEITIKYKLPYSEIIFQKY